MYTYVEQGKTPTCVFSLFRLRRNSPFRGALERQGYFALCGGRRALRVPALRSLLGKRRKTYTHASHFVRLNSPTNQNLKKENPL